MKGKKGGNTAFHAQRHKGIQSSVKENPFDKIANAKKKHDVLNRKVKGEDRNVGKARAKVRHMWFGLIIFSDMVANLFHQCLISYASYSGAKYFSSTGR